MQVKIKLHRAMKVARRKSNLQHLELQRARVNNKAPNLINPSKAEYVAAASLLTLITLGPCIRPK